MGTDVHKRYHFLFQDLNYHICLALYSSLFNKPIHVDDIKL